jgi:predicted nucleic acid-binding Zn finger protein
MKYVNPSEIRTMFPDLVWYGRRFDKAAELVARKQVKKHVFMPSGTVVYTVVGYSGDQLVDPNRPYCSCPDWFFVVARGKEDVCQHLLAFKIAEKLGFDEIVFSDEEYDGFIEALSRDIIDRNFHQ